MKIRRAYTIFPKNKNTRKSVKKIETKNTKSHKIRINNQNPTLKNDLITEKCEGLWYLGVVFWYRTPPPLQTTLSTHYGALKNPSNQTLKLKEPQQPDLKVKRSFENRYM